eukprot:4349846-Pleurochrysis_carterae.AAC.1
METGERSEREEECRLGILPDALQSEQKHGGSQSISEESIVVEAMQSIGIPTRNRKRYLHKLWSQPSAALHSADACFAAAFEATRTPRWLSANRHMQQGRLQALVTAKKYLGVIFSTNTTSSAKISLEGASEQLRGKKS